MQAPTDSAMPPLPGVRSATPGGSVLSNLERYWSDLRGARRVPVRTAVDPAHIDAALPHAFILERCAPQVARFRVCGQRITQFIGAESRGMPLSVLFTAQGVQGIGPLLERCLDDPAVVEVPVVSRMTLTRRRLVGSMLLLPLEGPDGLVDRVLGALLVDGAPGLGARSFDIDTSRPLRCDRIAPQTMAPAHRAVAGMAPPLPRMQEGPERSSRPALRLVVDNT
ncbi:PAS domain-containing protein [Loktanella sp. IMCC34160]|uniref:PAS domain-containing protein n=1 Tax=Loktanella sp. IMCC34160 TaxID=2510646 RepID=UPI00101DA298|nr:PAS domain-containing protein [Loktanella sp. IMCC34160]RYG92127.1 PAS domain-containing protein [Loktanella sp. IMCC34160]